MGKVTVGIQQIKHNVVAGEYGAISYDFAPRQTIFDLIYQCGARVVEVNSVSTTEFNVICKLINHTKYDVFVGRLLDDFPYVDFQLMRLKH